MNNIIISNNNKNFVLPFNSDLAGEEASEAASTCGACCSEG